MCENEAFLSAYENRNRILSAARDSCTLYTRDGFEDRMFEAKTKAGPTRGQGRGQGQA